MKSRDGSKFKVRRVDVQVSVLIACIVAVSCISVYLFSYRLTNQDMIYSLEDRVYSIYNFLNEEMDIAAFSEINTKDDMAKESYISAKRLFSSIKSATGVQYLYTAKRNGAGELIYVIDGLPDSAEDFRYPGDLIEQEIFEQLDRALMGESILPEDILHTPWGDIFITYLPMYDHSGNVIGAIGIEFAAGHQYSTYHRLRIAAPLIILGFCVLGTLCALVFFRRISNPHFKDIANTDYLTDLKNRNAYELDVKNLCAHSGMEGMGLLLADLNGLKRVNDTWGHEAGDRYIKDFADALRSVVGVEGVLYRIGGDEFLAMIHSATPQQLQGYMERIHWSFQCKAQENIPYGSCSIGSAICTGEDFLPYEKAYREADTEMYENKKVYYATEEATAGDTNGATDL